MANLMTAAEENEIVVIFYDEKGLRCCQGIYSSCEHAERNGKNWNSKRPGNSYEIDEAGK